MDPSRAPLSEAEFEEIMNRNRAISSSAISRAVSDASAGTIYCNSVLMWVFQTYDASVLIPLCSS